MEENRQRGAIDPPAGGLRGGARHQPHAQRLQAGKHGAIHHTQQQHPTEAGGKREHHGA